MAAPENTVWGSTVGGYGRIGIYKTLVDDNTTSAKVKVQVWFWSKYSVDDTANTLYYTLSSSQSEAKDSKGSCSIKTTVASGEGWSTSNQVKLYEYTHSATTKTTSTQTRYLYAKLINVDRVGGTMTVSTTISIPKLKAYTVKYNANGGSGAPSNQTKYHGTSLKLSSTKPTRSGYTFKCWNAKDDGTGATDFNPGGTYTGNSDITLYAIWITNGYTVNYNPNGGSGGPTSQTKVHGKTLTLTSDIPTRTNYNFEGWGTSASATTVAYDPGGSYTNNASITLYAIWTLGYSKPKITSVTLDRCDSDGNPTDEGTYALVNFDWSTELELIDISIAWKLSGDSEESSVSVSGSDQSGHVEAVVGDGLLDVDSSYSFTVTVTDSSGSSLVIRTLTGQIFPIDILPENKGIAFGRSAVYEDMMDIAWNMLVRKDAFIGRFQDEERNLIFKNDASENGKTYADDGVYPHNCKIYRGAGTSPIGIGMYDSANKRRIIAYNDHENYVYTESVLRHHAIIVYPATALTLSTKDEWTFIPIDTIEPSTLNSYFELAGKAIKCKKKGFIRVNAQVHFTGITANDYMGVIIQKDSAAYSWFHDSINDTRLYMNISDTIIEVSEGTYIQFKVKNSTGARGTVSAGRGYSRMFMEYIG